MRFFLLLFSKKNNIKHIETLSETLQLHSKENQACLEKQVKSVREI